MHIRRLFALVIASGAAFSGCVLLRPAMTSMFGEARVRATVLPMGDIPLPLLDRAPGYRIGTLPELSRDGVTPV